MEKGLMVLKSLSSRTTRSQVAIGLVFLLIGFLVATQLRAHQSTSVALQEASESDLSQIVGNLNNEINELKAESADLRLQLFKIERTNNDSSAVMEESFKNINNLKILSGLTKATGPGVKVKIIDRERALNANDIVDIITELRVGGAEAIAINGVRVVAQSGVSKKGHSIYIGDNQISAPFEIGAIGNPDVLQETLAIAGGVRDKLSSLTGVTMIITKMNSIQINAITSITEDVAVGQ